MRKKRLSFTIGRVGERDLEPAFVEPRDDRLRRIEISRGIDRLGVFEIGDGSDIDRFPSPISIEKPGATFGYNRCLPTMRRGECGLERSIAAMLSQLLANAIPREHDENDGERKTCAHPSDSTEESLDIRPNEPAQYMVIQPQNASDGTHCTCGSCGRSRSGAPDWN